MYVSRLCFHTLPGRTQALEERLQRLQQLVADAGGSNPRVLRTHLASDGAPDVIFEQDAPDLSSLESQIAAVTAEKEFESWSAETSGLLAQSPKREIYLVV